MRNSDIHGFYGTITIGYLFLAGCGQGLKDGRREFATAVQVTFASLKDTECGQTSSWELTLTRAGASHSSSWVLHTPAVHKGKTAPMFEGGNE